MEEEQDLRRRLIIGGIIVLFVVLLVVLLAETDRIRRLIWGVEEKVYFLDQNLSGLLRPEVKQVVVSVAQRLTYYPLQAELNSQTGKIIPEATGEILAVTETVERILAAEEETTVKPVLYSLLPSLTAEDIAQISTILGSYATLITGSQGRRKNIKLAARLINNQLLLPGELFSFNQLVGKRTKQRGFKEAPEIVEGELKLGVGGGICQVSSTLYNAVEIDKLKIVERHSHSHEVSYVPAGQDATVAWDYLDFKFENKFSTPVIIKANCQSGQLKVVILGADKIAVDS